MHHSARVSGQTRISGELASVSKCRNSPSDQSMAMNSNPMPFMSSNIAAGAGMAVYAAASNASRAPYTVLICLRRSSSRSSSRLTSALRCWRKGTAIAGLELFEPLASIAAQRLIPEMPDKILGLDAIDVQHSLGGQHFALAAERRWSLLGSGRLTIEHTRGSHACRQAASEQRFASILSVFAAAASRCRNRGRIDNMAFYSLILQHRSIQKR